jgi:hypothetical protein
MAVSLSLRKFLKWLSGPQVSLLISISLLGLTWVVYQPPFASVDEPNHAARAYTAVNGKLFFPENKDTAADAMDIVQVPNWVLPYKEPDSPYCFWQRVNITANCSNTDWTNAEIVERPNQFAQYFPTFYGIAGLPSIWLEGQVAYYLMRLFGLIAVLFVFYILLREVKDYHHPTLFAAPFIAITPMTISGAGTLAPLALETVAFAALTLFAYRFLKNGVRLPTGDLLRLLFIQVIALTSRPSGLVWSAILWLVLVFSLKISLRKLWRHSKISIWLILASHLIASFYLYNHRPKVNFRSAGYEITLFNSMTRGIQTAYEMFNNAVGIFGMDVYIPLIFYYLSFGIFSFLIFNVLQAKATTLTIKICVAALGALFLSIHIFANYYYRDVFANIWIGRYATPLLALLMVFVLLLQENRNLIWWFASFGLTINLLAIWISYLRYSVGFNGGDCCGILNRQGDNFQWFPLGFGPIGLLIASLLITVFFFMALRNAIKLSQNG